MDIFEHKLRALHTRSIEKIMNRQVLTLDPKRTHHSKNENITTYMRKFDIDRENLNLAKRIYQCQSGLSRDRYAREWKKTQMFMKVRSNFKKTLFSEEPRICKFEHIAGRGNLLVELRIISINPFHNQLQNNKLYSLRIQSGYFSVTPNNHFLTINCEDQKTLFYLPQFMKTKTVYGKLNQIIQNNIVDKGRFLIDISLQNQIQTSTIESKTNKKYGDIQFIVTCTVDQNKVRKNQGHNSMQFQSNRNTQNSQHNQNR